MKVGMESDGRYRLRDLFLLDFRKVPNSNIRDYFKRVVLAIAEQLDLGVRFLDEDDRKPLSFHFILNFRNVEDESVDVKVSERGVI